MNFSPSIAYPHPVLCPSDISDDYPNATFEITNRDDMVKVNELDSTAAKISCQFQLDDDFMKSLIDEGKAAYGLEVSCTRTLYRKSFSSRAPLIETEIPRGSLYGRVQILTYIAATQDIPNFQGGDSWHEDYNNISFNLEKGTLLAADMPFSYTAGNSPESEMSAIFMVDEKDSTEDYIEVFLDAEKVVIYMSQEAKRNYEKMEDLATRSPSAYFLISGVFLPALMQTISVARRSPEDYCERRWFVAINDKLTACEMPNLEETTEYTVLEEAQFLFEAPFVGLLNACERVLT